MDRDSLSSATWSNNVKMHRPTRGGLSGAVVTLDAWLLA